ncbi:TldD/PmbA family protein [Planctomycetota bacterium]|nr:TldD/PmbA family protein [Planctomycetota bacterium]MDB4736426.1 TldD/PmbA family protein [Planctomycetota bacterium]
MSTTSQPSAETDAREQRTELERRADLLIEAARAAGAQEVEVCARSGRSLSAKVEKGDLGQVQSDEGATCGLRVILDGRLGFASTNQASDEALRTMAAEAVAIARLSPPDEANVLSQPTTVDPGAFMGPRVDPALAAIGVREVVEGAQGLADAALARDPRLSVDQASFSAVSGGTLLVSTTGVRQFDFDAALSLSLMALAVDGDETGGFDYRGVAVRDKAALPAELDRIAGEVALSCIGNLGARAGKTYQGRVLFAPGALQSAILQPLLGSASAIAVQRGRSALSDRLGDCVAPGLSIVDDPTDRRSIGARAFDREGLAARRFDLLEEGVLNGFIHNGYSAAVDGVASTGHAQGGARGVPGLGFHALVIGPSAPEGGFEGAADEAALMRALGEGLYIQRFSGSVDAASGDFSGTAKSARWIAGGEVQHAVQEVMISGNAFDVLSRGLEVSSQLERLGGSSQICWGLGDGISVTAD